jgi:hypothetical protein
MPRVNQRFSLEHFVSNEVTNIKGCRRQVNVRGRVWKWEVNIESANAGEREEGCGSGK